MKKLSKRLLSVCLAISMAAPAFAEGRNVDGIWLDDGEVLKQTALPSNSPLVLDGWTRQGKGDVYRLKVRAGEKLKVQIASRSEFVVMAIFDFARPDDDAIFFSEAGNNTVLLTPKADTEWLIRPILILSAPRRGLGAHYEITVERQP